MLLSIVVVFFIFILIKYVSPSKKPPIFGIYEQPGVFYYLKILFMYIMIKLRTVKNEKHSSDLVLTHQIYIDEYGLYDFPQKLQNHPKAIDAVYFNGVSRDGEILICAIARRPNDICNGFFYLKTKNGDLLLSPKLPDTTLQQFGDEVGQYAVEGLKLYNITPMREWKISFNGMMKYYNNPEKMVSVELDATFTASWRHFNYDTDISPICMAKAIAKENWSREYFDRLKEVHQTHYEQFGTVQGLVKINDEVQTIHVDSVRDHSFGKFRDWRFFHRYALHFLHLSNGDQISLGIICMPICFSNLVIGFLCSKSDHRMYPVDSCNLQLWQIGENKTAPLDYAFTFKAGGKMYEVQIDVVSSPEFYIAQEREARIVERIVKCKVNGVEGWGAAEWQYRNIDPNVIADKK